jgi:hypothetical protein
MEPPRGRGIHVRRLPASLFEHGQRIRSREKMAATNLNATLENKTTCLKQDLEVYH